MDKLFIGIDLNYNRAMVSFFFEGMSEPETVSTVPGEEHFRIPTSVFCENGGNHYCGDEAVRRRNDPDGTYFSHVYREALESDNVVYRNIFMLFLRYLLQFSERFGKNEYEPYLAFSLPEINDDVVHLFDSLRKDLDWPAENFQLMEYRESFFAYAYHQDPFIYSRDVVMFEYEKGKVMSILVHADTLGEVKRVTSVQENWDFPASLEGQNASRDEYFSNIVRGVVGKNIISGVYFVGDGFDGRWMSASLRAVGPNKRVFKGKNLYTVGACYAGYRNRITEGWNFYFDCDYKLQGEVTLKAMDEGEPKLIRLVQLGENWFSPTEKYFFLYDGDPTLETWTRVRQRVEARKDTFTLEFLPERDPRSIRLSIQAFPVSGKEVLLRVMDDGFGELFEASGKLWEFPIRL